VFAAAIGKEKFDSAAGILDEIRLEHCFRSIFYGIYRHHFGKIFSDEICAFIGFPDYLSYMRCICT
jgi:hypothetical protein